jgi:hypothetical protein
MRSAAESSISVIGHGATSASPLHLSQTSATASLPASTISSSQTLERHALRMLAAATRGRDGAAIAVSIWSSGDRIDSLIKLFPGVAGSDAHAAHRVDPIVNGVRAGPVATVHVSGMPGMSGPE